MVPGGPISHGVHTKYISCVLPRLSMDIISVTITDFKYLPRINMLSS